MDVKDTRSGSLKGVEMDGVGAGGAERGGRAFGPAGRLHASEQRRGQDGQRRVLYILCTIHTGCCVLQSLSVASG